MASVAELIAQNLVATIETISVANGYANNISTASGGGGAQRFEQAGQKLNLLPTVVIVELGESNKDRSPDGISPGAYTCTLNYALEAVTTTPTGYSGSSAAHIDSLVRDIEKALRVDRLRGQGPKVIETKLNGYDSVMDVDSDGGIAHIGAVVNVVVIYRHAVNDPSVGWP